MKSIRIMNLRSLADTEPVELRPITLLLGRNSSGKSTFLRTFPLLRQSVESRTSGPILWFGRYVDFGDFGDAVRVDAAPPFISFEFQFDLPWLNRYSSGIRRPDGSISPAPSNLGVSVTIELTQEEKDGTTRANRCHITVADHRIQLGFDRAGRVTQFEVNSLNVLDLGSDFTLVPIGYFIPQIQEKVASERDVDPFEGRRLARRMGRVRSSLIRELRPLFHANTKIDTVSRISARLGLSSSEQMLERMKRSGADNKTYRRRVASLSLEHSKFKRIRDLRVAEMVPRLLDRIDQYVFQFSSGITYMAPLSLHFNPAGG